MCKTCVFVLVSISLVTTTRGIGSEGETTGLPMPPKSKFHLFLLAGQSNMAGRGKIADVDTSPHRRVLALNQSNQWVAAVDPIHFDKPVAGVGLGRTFGVTLAERDPTITVGLIPCAAGGSPISSWEPGGYHAQTQSHPYDDAIKRTKVAMQKGTLKGILWHQGESDSRPDLSAMYQPRLHALIQRFRTEFDSPELPFIAGQLGRFPERPWDNSRESVNSIHASLPQAMNKTAFVSSGGFSHKGDLVHFDSKSLRQFGKRYAEAYFELTQR